MTDPDNKLYTYTYDPRSSLVKLVNPQAETTTHTRVMTIHLGNIRTI